MAVEDIVGLKLIDLIEWSQGEKYLPLKASNSLRRDTGWQNGSDPPDMPVLLFRPHIGRSKILGLRPLMCPLRPVFLRSFASECINIVFFIFRL